MPTTPSPAAVKTTLLIPATIKLGIETLVREGAVKNQTQFIQAALEQHLERTQRLAKYAAMKTKLKSIKQVAATQSVLDARDSLRGGR